MEEGRKPEYPKPLTTSFIKCHILEPEDSSPKRDSNRSIALVAGWESRRANRYTSCRSNN